MMPAPSAAYYFIVAFGAGAIFRCWAGHGARLPVLRIARLARLSHSAGADQRQDLVGAQAASGSERQGRDSGRGGGIRAGPQVHGPQFLAAAGLEVEE